MDRKGIRGSKPKNVPPRDLFALGTKSSSSASGSGRSSNVGSSSSSSDLQPTQIEKGYGSKASGSSSDRGREGHSGLISKKSSKSGFHNTGALSRPGGSKVTSTDVTEEWERVAEEVDLEDLLPFIEAAEEREDLDRIEAYLCGAIKILKSQKLKPDNILCLTLLYLAKVKPYAYNSPLTIEALCSLLKRSEHSLTFKSKSNTSLSVLIINILLASFQEEKCWPDIFVRSFMEDSLGERQWVDHEDCKGFVDNIVASFRTKMPSKSLLFPDLGISSKMDCPSPPVVSDSGEGDVDASVEYKDNPDVNVCNRFAHMSQEIAESIMESVHLQLNARQPNVDRNFIRFLSTVSGILEVRKVIAPKLENWLGNHKHQRLATELLMSICLNCNTHSPIDQKVIKDIVYIRLKHKPLTNQYMACLRELLSAHPDNIAVVMRETIFNELSNLRNLSNMSILSVVFQYAPEHAALILADIFLELLRNSEDFLRALRVLLREIIRSLRHDLQYLKFCQGLMKEIKDSNFREFFEHRERMFHSIVDLIVICAFVSISPQVREASTQMCRGEGRDLDAIRRYQEVFTTIQQEAMHWMYRIAPKCYNPSKEEYVKCLNKLLMLDQTESYYHKDNWPLEIDRPLFFRLAFELPLKQETLTRLLLIGSMKEQYVKPQDVIELAEKLIKRVTGLSSDTSAMFLVDDAKIIDLIFNLCPYIHPENSRLPPCYRPPKTAIANLYWKAWIMILLTTAHNPGVFGVLAWDTYPTLRAMMEMCITNSFSFPPPTMCIGDKGEEMLNQENALFNHEKQQILEFESYLAPNAITEQNSLLLSVLITMDPTGPARKPPPYVLDQLKALNASSKIGNLLCRCRKPDFLLDIIQRQGAPQSMPWLAQLVQSSEDAFSVLPVQGLCEFLLSETVLTADGSITSRHHQLLQHLRSILRYPQQDDNSLQIMEYFLRRLSSQQPGSRTQAVRGLHLIVAPITEAMEVEPDGHEPYAWLLHQVPSIPGFNSFKASACQALRSACQIETQPSAVSAYIRFLAVHTSEDSLQDMAALVQDMAQLIVERSIMIPAILPSFDQSVQQFPHAKATLDALFVIFINYMRAVRLPSQEVYPWSKNQDHVRVQWATGEQAVMHILVVHAMVILLIYGPSATSKLFHQLLNSWFPENQDMPKAFLIDTTQEALLLPDWLKLKMIHSNVPQLVDAALKDLEPSQLVLFIQSFGIPVASMTKLLCALDAAVETNEAAVAEAVLAKSHSTYMAQLVEVQHQRGARGGHAFAATLGETNGSELASDRPQPLKPLITPLKVSNVLPMELTTNEVQSFIQQCYTISTLHRNHKKQVKDTMRILQQHISCEMSGNSMEKPYIAELLRSFVAILQGPIANTFIIGLHQHYPLSAPLFRLLLQMKDKPNCNHLFVQMVQIVRAILHMNTCAQFSLSSLLQAFLVSADSSVVTNPLLTTEPLTVKDFVSEQSVLNRLASVSPSTIEKQIRELVEFAMKNGKISLVVNAIVHFLVRKLNNEGGNNVPVQHIALLLDWMQVLDPELCLIPRHLSKLLLFGRSKPIDKKLKEKCVVKKEEKQQTDCNQVYLLAAFTHQATWATLERTVNELLSVFDADLNPSAVLDFVYAVLHVPKLWQGREKRKPRHIRPQRLLKLSSNEVVNLCQYILLECQLQQDKKDLSALIQKRIPLLFHCLGEQSVGIAEAVKHLTDTAAVKSEDGSSTDKVQITNQFLYHLYLQRPCIIKHLSSRDMTLIMRFQMNSPFLTQSAADSAVHTLLTMLTAPLPGEDFVKRMEDIEAAVRKLTSVHPLLVIRHLALLSATLQGVCHLQLPAFQAKNYPILFSMVLGVLELLQPLIFFSKYRIPFCKTLDAFIELFEEHGRMREFGGMVMRICQLLMAWTGFQGSAASTYIAKHSSLFNSLLRRHPEMLPLRSLAAIAASRGTDHPQAKNSTDSEETFQLSRTLKGPPLPPWILQQVRELHTQFDSFKTSDEQEELLSRVSDLGRQSIGNAVVPFIHNLSEGLLSDSKKVRLKCWDLLAIILRKNPHLSQRVSKAVQTALCSEDLTVASTAVSRLQEVILLLHEHSADLLTAAFNVCLSSEASVTDTLSDAVFLLTIDTGA